MQVSIVKSRFYQIVCILVCFFSGNAQQYFFKNYSSENGMPFVQVYCMFQDSKGYLYSGGYGGISRFDGKEFTNITTKDGLSDNNVFAIGEDDKQRIIVGTRNGISVLEDGRINKRIDNTLLNDKSIFCIKRSAKGHVFIGTNAGVYTFQQDKFSKVNSVFDVEVKALESMGNTLFCATNKGLLISTETGVKVIDERNGLSSNRTSCLALNEEGTLLAIGTDNGLNFYDIRTGKIKSYYIQNGLIDNSITALLYEADGGLWIGSQTGLIKLENNEFNYYNIYYENNSNLIRCLTKDTESNLWVGTHSGIYRYRDNSFSTFDRINGPGNAFIFQIFRNGEDLYVCSENNGFYKYAQGYFKRYGIKDGLPDNDVKSGTANSKGRIFFYSSGEVVEFKGSTFSRIQVSKMLDKINYKMFCDSKDRIWLSGKNGVSCFNSQSFPKADTVFYPFEDYPENTEVTDIYEDEDGTIWVAAYGSGIYQVNNTSLVNYSTANNIKEKEVVSIIGQGDHLYIGTFNGLMILNKRTKTYEVITKKDGLISDIIYAIGFSKNKNNLWIGTNQGISEFNCSEYIKTKKVLIRSYSKNEGFTGIELNSNGIFEDTDGTVWFGTVSGLVKHLPGNYKYNKVPSKTNIYKFKVGETDTLLTKDVVLPYSLNNITFYYRGICLTDPEKVLYSTKLEGYDRDYSNATNESFAKYTNLSPGTYTFCVLSSNNEGEWNKEPTRFVFTISTPFYRTWWFITGTLLLSVVSVYTVFKIRIRNIQQKQQKEFERKVEISKVELKALRSQMNPHFVFNSLNSIQHYIFNSKSDEAVKYLNKFAKLMRVILNNSDKPTVAIEDDLEALKLYLELEQMRFEDKFEYKIYIDENVDLDYDIMPPMLLQPYVENAILHGLSSRKEKGLLTIGVRNEEQFIVCTITDNGIGRKKAAEIKRTMPGSKHKSLGMKITEERLRILNEISQSKHSVKITDLEDANGNSLGTKVEIYVPIV